MKNTLALLSATVLTTTLTFGGYPKVVFKNETKKTVRVTVKYAQESSLACRADVFDVPAGATASPKGERGVCLISSITTPGAKAYNTSGSSASTFGLVQNADSSLSVCRFENGKPVVTK